MSKEHITPENFCYWLQGKIEIDGEIKPLTKKQVEVISEHLQKVFNKVTKKTLSGEEVLRELTKPEKFPSFPDLRPIC